MNREQTQPRDVSDAQIRAMLEAFAGPAAPLSPAERSGRRASRRTVTLLVAALVALGLAVPGALALLGHWQTPKQFYADRSEPAYARRFVHQWFAQHGWGPQHIRLIALEHALTAHTPNGEAIVYALRYTGGDIGYAVIDPGLTLGSVNADALGAYVFVLPTNKALEGPANTVPYRACPRGWALQRLGGGTPRIGQTFGYVIGRASTKVASVHVLYRDGSTTQGAAGNGYFLAWMKPSAGWTNVTLIAEDAAGKTVARLPSAGYGGIPFLPTKPRSPFACAP